MTTTRTAPAREQDARALEERFAIPSYAKWPLTLVRGEGCRVWDDRGSEYIDFYGGHCVALIGHGHPHWVGALATQAARFGFYSNVTYNDVRVTYLERLIAFSPAHLTRAFLCNSGAEANETAVKLALKATGRPDVVAMEGGFHGRTAGALSLTHLGHYRDQFPSIVRPTVAVPFGDVAALKAKLGPTVAAVIIEPIQSMNGMNTAPAPYYRDLVAACHANGTLVIFDEIQTGMGRLGASFAAALFDAPADIVTTAKGIGNGYPMGAVLATEAVARTVAQGEQGTTFGGGPLACAAGMAVLDVLDTERLVPHAAAMERFARETLIVGPVTGIRGHGMLLGLETRVPAKGVASYLMERRMLVGTSSDPKVLRLMPPLVLGKHEIEALAGALADWK